MAKSTLKQSDITRAIKTAVDLNLPIRSYEISREGTIGVHIDVETGTTDDFLNTELRMGV
ncbi:MAG: hypothetical protein AAGC81_10025 [Pseudomonadota bacterium]